MNESPAAEVLQAESLGPGLARWQLPRFDQGGPPTAQRLEDIEAAAYQEGLQRGQAEGFAVGQKAALAQAQRLQTLIEHMARPLAHLDEETEQALVELASAIARRILGEELSLRPERVVGMVREALAGVPPMPRSVRINVHPDDVALVREHVRPAHEIKDYEVVGDATLKRGDCRVVTESSQIDARLDERVRIAALPQDEGPA
ncbi:FliH/SctL family protein [Fontimonas sp. SYSU GA230001]|uniref:FliH/SctL family protein n=1 Tax=Fontimonas sp. SYSU GA230001 TaxID=3142450 RepID=UPI0032B3E2EF